MNLKNKVMVVIISLIIIVCSFIIVHHLYKVKDYLDVEFKDLKYFQNHTNQSIDRIDHLLGEIDSIVSDIEDAVEDKRTKFICKNNDAVVELNATAILNIKPTIDNNGNALLIVNYYDVDFCLKSTIVSTQIDIKTEQL